MPDEVSTLKAGDKVVVSDGWHARHGRRSIPGEVVRVGRALVSIKFGGCTEMFRIDTGVINLSSGGWNFMTMEQHERDMRRTAAIAALKAHRIEFRLGYERSFTLEQVEALAEVARSWDAEGGQ